MIEIVPYSKPNHPVSARGSRREGWVVKGVSGNILLVGLSGTDLGGPYHCLENGSEGPASSHNLVVVRCDIVIILIGY